MQYRTFGKTGETVSVLGFGCMRLPLIPGGNPTQIDEPAATALLHQGIESGINYIDTAYPYHGTSFDAGGESELFVGRALQGGWREKVKLATKLPSWLVKTREDMDRYLNEQLERLQTDHIDFYLVHNLNKQVWPGLLEKGLVDFLNTALADGRIRHAGFSFHDQQQLFMEIVDAYDWSFCQIQYNYLDEHYQAGLEGLNYAASKGMGIAIMEPLRGGKLAVEVPGEALETFQGVVPERTPADWALRWVWNHSDVAVVLSGMNTPQQLQENIKTATEALPESMTLAEIDGVNRVKTIYRDRMAVGCTACGYCMPCPVGVAIPLCFSNYNSYFMFGQKDDYRRFLNPSQWASACVACGKCVSHCPQAIAIPEVLKDVAALIEV